MPWPLPEGEAGRLELAKGYPYAAPDTAYLLRGGRAVPFFQIAREAPARLGEFFAGRTAVVAHGSNRSPEQLLRKFGAEAELPVTFGWLADHDVVYSAHLTRYGAIASNLIAVVGCRVRVAINWLDDAQLARMHETEGATYPFGVLQGAAFTPEPLEGTDGRLPAPDAPLHVYVSRHGCLRHGETVAGLTAVHARGRPHGAVDQLAALAYVCRRYRPELTVDRMILDHVASRVLREELIALMAADAVEAPLTSFRLVAGLDHLPI